MRKSKVIAVLLALAMVATMFAGCTPKNSVPPTDPSNPTTPPTTTAPVATPGPKDKVVLYEANEIRTLVQWNSSDSNASGILCNAFEGLYRMDKEHNPIPAMATGYTVSDDKLTYTFTLRDGINWSNGTPVTAHDFVFSWLKQMSLDATNGYNFIMNDYIVNGNEYLEGKATAEQVGVKALDAKTLEVKIKNPTPYFLRLTTLTNYMPLNKEFVETQGESYGVKAENMIYNGPYTIQTYDPGVGTVLVKNDKYWDAANVQVPSIEVKIIKDQSSALNTYKAGGLSKVTLSSTDVGVFKSSPEFHQISEFRTNYIQYNTQVPELANVNIRTALTIAIDRQVLADVMLADGSAPAYGLVADGMSGIDGKTFREINGDMFPRDVAKAKEYWDKGLAELGGKTPKLTLLIADDSLTKNIAVFIQSEFKKNLGIDVQIDSKTSKARNQLMDDNNFQMAIVGWGADYDDAMTYLDLWTAKDKPYRGNYYVAPYLKLIADAKVEPNDAKRIQMLLDAEKMLVQTDAVVSPLYYRGFAYLQKENLKDLVIHPFGNPLEYKYASLVK